jgi:hypothetical protein
LPVARDRLMIVNALLLIAALALAALALGIGLWMALTLKYAIIRDGWRKTPGVVTDSRVVPNRPANGLPGHHSFVRFTFIVAGEEFRSSSVRFGDFRYLTRKRAGRVVAKYPVGSEVMVHYDQTFEPNAIDDPDPAQPIAVLEPGLNAECLYPITVFLIVLALTVTSVAMLVARITR